MIPESERVQRLEDPQTTRFMGFEDAVWIDIWRHTPGMVLQVFGMPCIEREIDTLALPLQLGVTDSLTARGLCVWTIDRAAVVNGLQSESAQSPRLSEVFFATFVCRLDCETQTVQS